MFDSGRSYFLGRSHIRLAPPNFRYRSPQRPMNSKTISSCKLISYIDKKN